MKRSRGRWQHAMICPACSGVNASGNAVSALALSIRARILRNWPDSPASKPGGVNRSHRGSDNWLATACSITPVRAQNRRNSHTAVSVALTVVAVAQNEIRRLRAERDKLRGRLRLQLGAEIDGPDRADLIARVAALEAASRQFAAERDARAAEASHAQRRVLELKDELTAARESLRRAIRQANR